MPFGPGISTAGSPFSPLCPGTPTSPGEPGGPFIPGSPSQINNFRHIFFCNNYYFFVYSSFSLTAPHNVLHFNTDVLILITIFCMLLKLVACVGIFYSIKNNKLEIFVTNNYFMFYR